MKPLVNLGHMKRLLLVVVIGLAVVATVLPDSDETVSSALQVSADPAALYDTDPWFRKIWVRGCVASGESAAFCRCAITEYTTRLQPYEFEIAHAVAHSEGRLAELREHVREVVKDVERGVPLSAFPHHRTPSTWPMPYRMIVVPSP